MSMTIVVRPCEEADVPLLTEREINPKNETAKKHFARQQEGKYLWAVAWDGAEPLGTCALDWRDSDTQPELRNLWVYPHARRRGVGRILSQWIEQYARDLGYREIFLAVSLDNEAAIPLYVSLDYSPTGMQRANHYSAYDADGVLRDIDEINAIFRKSLVVTDH